MSDRYKGAILSSTAPTVTPQSANGIYTLSQQTQYQGQGVWPSYGKQLTNSLRFRSSASASLTRTPASSSNRRTWTWSAWVKLGRDPDGFFPLFGADNNNSYPSGGISLTNNNIQFFSYTDPTYAWQKISTLVLRDYSAWYHIVAVIDTTNATAEDRAIVYVNNQRITSWSTNNNPSLNFEGYVNSSSYVTKLGRVAGFGYFDGYMAEVNFVDGQALTPSSFGMTNAAGTWSPIGYSGTYGTNGFYLPFTNTTSTSTLGNDFSGNGNNFTVNNISLTAGTTYDSMTDVPTNTSGTASNYCTGNPLNQTDLDILREGNLYWKMDNERAVTGTIAMNSGKWYWEVTAGTIQNYLEIGIVGTNARFSGPNNFPPGSISTGYSYRSNGTKINNNSSTSYGSTFTTGDIIGVAFDADAGTLTFYKNNVSQGTAYSSIPVRDYVASGYGGPAPGTTGGYWNFGQRPFAYTPPTGFVALNTTNLSSPTILAGNQYFDATLYTGNGTNNRIISSNLTPDFVWMKDRTNAYSHILIDSVRGIGRYLRTNGTNDENWDGNLFPNSGPTTNGFIVDGVSNVSINANGDSYVAWNWKASNAAAVTNTAGTISSQVSANPTSGFSIVTFTGNGTSAQTVGHGLGVTPTFFILKSRGVQVWNVYSLAGGITGNTILQLNDTSGAVTGGNISLTASSTTIGFGSASQVNGSGVNFVAYVFAPVAGYSAMGSYTGNGSTDGPFIFTGFRPRFVMFKGSSIASNWCMLDSARNTYNLTDATLQANSSAAELTNLSDVDFLSNGIKIRDVVTNDTNVSGQTYIYMAFAENPFKYANAR